MAKIFKINNKLRDQEYLIQNQFDFTKSILNMREAIFYLGVSGQMYKLASINLLPYSKPGAKLIYFRKDDLDAWVMSNPISTHAELEMKASQQVFNAFPFKHIKIAS